ncbi:hypothetical protein JNK13_06430 [bacterium]|nr:hypothetical protein [bacterium]
MPTFSKLVLILLITFALTGSAIGQAAPMEIIFDTPQPTLISFQVVFTELPKPDANFSLISKIDRSQRAKPGWALAISNRGSSIRPEAYFRGADGSGGFYLFDRYDFELNRPYWVVFIVQVDRSLSLYIQALEPKHQGDISPSFLGAQSIKNVSIPQPQIAMQISEENQREKLTVSDLRILRPQTLPILPQQVIEFLSGGPEKVVPQH